MALSGIGPIVYPPMITYFLNKYDVTGSVLILGGLSFNIVVAALLLQPIKHHYIVQLISANDQLLENGQTVITLNNIDTITKNEITGKKKIM